MIENIDYRKYLSADNGKGLLLKHDNVSILNQYGINYLNYSDLNDLILMIGSYIDEHYDEDIDDLEEVLEQLMEIYYYTQVKK